MPEISLHLLIVSVLLLSNRDIITIICDLPLSTMEDLIASKFMEYSFLFLFIFIIFFLSIKFPYFALNLGRSINLYSENNKYVQIMKILILMKVRMNIKNREFLVINFFKGVKFILKNSVLISLFSFSWKYLIYFFYIKIIKY